MSNKNLIHIFNNQYERNSRHRDTYFTDKPGMTEKEMNETNQQNYQVLKQDTLQQIQYMKEYFDSDNVLYYTDRVYQDLLTYNEYNNIDDFINTYFIEGLFGKDEVQKGC